MTKSLIGHHPPLLSLDLSLPDRSGYSFNNGWWDEAGVNSDLFADADNAFLPRRSNLNQEYLPTTYENPQAAPEPGVFSLLLINAALLVWLVVRDKKSRKRSENPPCSKLTGTDSSPDPQEQTHHASTSLIKLQLSSLQEGLENKEQTLRPKSLACQRCPGAALLSAQG